MTVGDFRVIDSHVHFWDQQRLGYPWLDLAGPAYQGARLPHDLVASRSTADAVVAVQADCLSHQGLAEAQWLHDLAAAGAPIAAIVAHAALESPDDRGEQLAALARLPLVVGVRRLLQDAEPGFATSPHFVEGVRSLAAHGFTMDLCIRDPQLPEATRLVEQCPDVRFVLDHLGKPSIRSQDFAEWAGNLSRLAALPNVVVKLSGLSSEASPEMRSPSALAPWLLHGIDAFGPARCMFGSDWPVVSAAGGLERWVETVAEVVADLTAEDAAAIWSGTAEATYLSRVST